MKNNLEQYKKEIIDVLYKVGRDKNYLADFLKEILTPREFENIAVRWQIVERLGKGEHHHAIAEALHVGVATVTRGSREMRKKDCSLRKALKVIHS